MCLKTIKNKNLLKIKLRLVENFETSVRTNCLPSRPLIQSLTLCFAGTGQNFIKTKLHKGKKLHEGSTLLKDTFVQRQICTSDNFAQRHFTRLTKMNTDLKYINRFYKMVIYYLKIMINIYQCTLFQFNQVTD